MAFAPPLVAEREHDSGFAAGLGDRPPLRDGVGDRLVEKNMLARRRRAASRLEVRVVRRGVDDRLDRAVLQDRLVAWRRSATVLRGEGLALALRARVARDDFQFLRALDSVGKDVRPPAHADAGDPQGLKRHRLLWTCSDGFYGLARDALVGRPVAAAHADAADALALHEDRAAAFHRGPALGARGEREPERVDDVERLPLSAVRRGRPLVRGGADGLG